MAWTSYDFNFLSSIYSKNIIFLALKTENLPLLNPLYITNCYMYYLNILTQSEIIYDFYIQSSIQYEKYNFFSIIETNIKRSGSLFHILILSPSCVMCIHGWAVFLRQITVFFDLMYNATFTLEQRHATLRHKMQHFFVRFM